MNAETEFDRQLDADAQSGELHRKLGLRPRGQRAWRVTLNEVTCRQPLRLGDSKPLLIYSATPAGIRALVKKLAPLYEPAWAVGYSGYGTKGRW